MNFYECCDLTKKVNLGHLVFKNNIKVSTKLRALGKSHISTYIYDVTYTIYYSESTNLEYILWLDNYALCCFI